MSYQEEYKKKLVTPAEAAKLVQSGWLVDYGFFNAKPIVLDEALAARHEELTDVSIYTAVTMPPLPQVALYPQSFSYHDFQWSKLTRMMAAQNPRVYYVPVVYHHMPHVLRTGGGPRRNIGFFQVAPMDKYGWFNLGPQASEGRSRMERDDIVVLEVNPNMPVCLGGAQESVHISQIDYVVEAPETQQLFAAPGVPEPTEVEKRIAGNLMPYIEDGSCIQLGIGGMPNAVGKMIADSDLKDLGGHTEMLVDAYMDMIEAGRMTGARKTLDRHRVAFTFAIGTQKLYDFMNHNPGIASYGVEYTNHPKIISQLDKFVSINNAVEVDLYTQVNAESQGFKQISGNGGMWDFVLGSQWSKGGKSFICLTSTFKGADGQLKSRIVPTFAQGSITTIPRQMVDHIVTEYGVARMHGLPTWGRAEAMVNLAHPDFRQGLIAEAAKMGIWRQSNKK